MNLKILLAALSTFCIPFFLLACSKTAPERNYCPRYTLISELDRMPVTTALTHQGEIRILQVASKCDGDYMDIGLQTRLLLSDNDSTLIEKDLPFFVAVIDDKENVIDRKDFILKVKATGPSEIQIHKQSYILMPNFDWKTMRIYVGLSLTPEQRQHNAAVKTWHEQSFSAQAQVNRAKKASGN